MAFWKYKPTQGYWSRTLTLIGAMMMVCAGAFWIWNELKSTDPTIGKELEPIVLAPKQPPAASLEELGIVCYDPAALDPEGTQDLSELMIESPGARTPAHRADLRQKDEILTFDGETITSKQDLVAAFADADPSKPITINVTRRESIRIYIQGGVAAVLIIGFLFYMFYLLNKPKVCEFLIATESEMKKVNWPSRREIIGSTWLVIAGTFMLALVLFLIDLAFTLLFQQMGVLKVAT